MAEPRLIKKYANRRLYDTHASAYITLDGIRDLIVGGHEVKIVDDGGADISRSILLQIIAEQEQGGRPMLDPELLTRMIRLYGKPMQDVAGQFLARSFDTFMEQQARYHEQISKAMAATPLQTLQKLTEENLKAWESMQDAFFGKTVAADDDDKE